MIIMKSQLVFYLVHVHIIIATSGSEERANISTLRFVQSLIRHGDRTPAFVHPTDQKNRESTWNEGLGELTAIGIRQQYRLGEFIKRRYRGFLTESYDAKEIHIRSTGYNRTIMSAIANVAGMYPPVGGRIWNDNLVWQPVPIHTRPKEDDTVLWLTKPCPTVDKLYESRVFSSNDYNRINEDNTAFFDFLRQKIGRKERVNLEDMWIVFDPLNCETIHNETHKRPEWANDTVFERVKELYRQSMDFYYPIPEIQRLRGGLLLHELASRMIEKMANKSGYVQQLKYYAYFAHDLNHLSILQILSVFDGSPPSYDQLLLLEMHEIDGKHFIKLYKHNDSNNNDVILINIPSCGDPCEVETFHRLSLSKMPVDWESECGLTGSSKHNPGQVIGILIVVCILLIVSFVVALIFYCRLKCDDHINIPV